MTVITPASEYAHPDEFDPRRDAKLRRQVLEDQQTEALRRRLAERAEPRVHNEEKLASSRSLVDANEPTRVATVRSDNGKPSVTAYLLSQESLLDQFRSERISGVLPESFSLGAYRTFQVPVRRIAGLTGLDVAPYIAAEPLERLETTGLPRELVQKEHILL